MNVVFDALETLFDPAPLRELLGEAPFEAWFERTLQSAAALTLLGEFAPFAQLARSTLATTCAALDLEVDSDEVVARLSRLQAGSAAVPPRPPRAGCGGDPRRGPRLGRGGRVRAGMRGVWVTRHERTWRFPEAIAPHETAPDLVEAVRAVITAPRS